MPRYSTSEVASATVNTSVGVANVNYALSASYALRTLSASYAPGAPTENSTSASYALTASYAANAGGSSGGSSLITASLVPITASISLVSNTSSYLSGSMLVGSWPSNSTFDVVGTTGLSQVAAGNYAILQNRSTGQTIINSALGQQLNLRINNSNIVVITGSGLTVTGNVIANSFTGSIAGTASYWDSSSLVTLIGTKQGSLVTASLLPITSSHALTSSFALNAGGGTTLATGSLIPVTASVALVAVNWDSSSFVIQINNKQGSIVTGSLLPVTASHAITCSYSNINIVQALYTTQSLYATQSISSSYATRADNLDGYDSTVFQFSIATASLIPITSSWSQNATNWNSSSVVSLINTKQGSLITASLIPITSSHSITASFVGDNGKLITSSLVPITSSWSVNATNWNSSSVITLIGTKQGSLVTGSLIPITASHSITSSYWDSSALVSSINTKQGSIVTGSLLPITASHSITSSYSGHAAFSYQTSNYVLTNNDNGNVVSLASASAVTFTITSSLSSDFSCVIFHSGSGATLFTGSQVNIRARNSATGSSAQYGFLTVLRMPNGDFAVGGNLG